MNATDTITDEEIKKAMEIINLYILGQEPPLEDLDWAIQTAYYHHQQQAERTG